MYDLLIVGAGITAATIVSLLKKTHKICIIDTRLYFGGNCSDYEDNGSFIHLHGPHIYHSTSKAVTDHLSKYTKWKDYNYAVEAEIEHDGKIVTAPFPYSRLTAKSLGRELTQDEVIDRFFKGYSTKMWGMDWDKLPTVIKNRVPKDTAEQPNYFPGQFVGMPDKGFSHMIANMMDGVTIRLGVPTDEWVRIPARKVIFTGRPDLIKVPGENATFGEVYGLNLAYRTLQIDFRTVGDWPYRAPVLNCCHTKIAYSRITNYAKLTGGNSNITSFETPKAIVPDEVSPYYPLPTPEQHVIWQNLTSTIRQHYPSILFAGRLGSHKYLDMFQAVGQGLALVKATI